MDTFRKSILFAFCISGFQFSLVGTLFLSDIITLFLIPFAITHYLRSSNRETPLLLALFIFPIAFLICDIQNQIGFRDYTRTFARTTLMLMNVFLARYFIFKFGFQFALTCLALNLISFGVFSTIQTPDFALGTTEYFKKGGGGRILFGFVFFAGWIPYLQHIFLGTLTTVWFSRFDSRTGNFLYLTGFLGSFFLHFPIFKKKIPKNFFIFIVIILVPIIGVSLLKLSVHPSFADDETIARRTMSNMERSDLAHLAIDGLKDSPIYGNGSFTANAVFLSKINLGSAVGIHSWVLQMGYEFGISGLVFSLFVLVTCVLGGIEMAYSRFDLHTIRKFGGFLSLLFVLGVFDIIFNPFKGDDRVFFGFLLAFSIYFINLSRTSHYYPITKKKIRAFSRS